MHEHARLREIVGEDARERRVERRALPSRRACVPRWRADVPVGEERRARGAAAPRRTAAARPRATPAASAPARRCASR